MFQTGPTVTFYNYEGWQKSVRLNYVYM